VEVYGVTVSPFLFWGASLLLLVGAMLLILLGGLGLLRRRGHGPRCSLARLDKELGDIRFTVANLDTAGHRVRESFAQGVKAMCAKQYQDAAGMFRAGARDASPGERAELMNLVGISLHLAGRQNVAPDSFEQAVAAAEGAADRRAQAAALSNLALVYLARSEPAAALVYQEQALEIDRETGNAADTATGLGRLGLIRHAQHQPDRAMDLHTQALDLHRSLDDQPGIANDLGRIGFVYQTLDQSDKALECYNQALEVARKAAYLQGTAELLSNIGMLHNEQGDSDEALRHLLSALALFAQTSGETRMLNTANGLRVVRRKLGRDRFTEGCRKYGMNDRDLTRLLGLIDRIEDKTKD
jgi:tetratricopeptide (TPR) repeat protein